MSLTGNGPSRRYLKHLESLQPTVELVKTKPQKPSRRILRGSRVTPVVYFVQAANLRLIKIGVTLDVGDRLKTLRVGSPDQLELIGAMRRPDAEDIERRLHARFRQHRSHGEWFHPSEEILALVAEWPVDRMEREEDDEMRDALRAVYGPRP